MQYSIVNLSQIVSDFRIDAECYKKEYLEIEERLKKKQYTTIRRIVKTFSKGIFDIKAECYSDVGVPFVRISDLKNMLIDDSNIVHIPEEESEKAKNSVLSYGDVVLSKTAYPAASLVSLERCNTSQDTIAVKLRDDSHIKSHFLVTFLNSKYGFLQMKRWFTGNIQMHLNLKDSKGIIIPILSDNFQDLIEEQFERVISQIEKSKELYDQAQNLILSELGLLDWNPKHQLTFVRNFSKTQQAERIDAEYFQPKYDEIVEAIKRYSGGWNTVGNLLNIKDKNFYPKKNVVYKYIELANIGGNGEITGCTELEGQELPTRARRKVSKGDVIVSSIEGSLSSIALITEEYNRALCSTGFYVVDSDDINSETLLVLLKSPIGQLQLKKGCSGTILTAINKDELEKIILPQIDGPLQEEIKQKITESFNLRKQSKHLLESAKKAVEIAIEEDEDTALEWLNNEVGEVDA